MEKWILPVTPTLLCKGSALVARLSTKCSRWAIVVSQCLPCVVHRATSTIDFKAYSSYTPGPIDSKLGRKHCRSKVAKIGLIRNPRWPPSWKSVYRFFSWAERPDWLETLVGNIWMTCRSKIVKIVPTGNPRWLLCWKSIFCFFS